MPQIFPAGARSRPAGRRYGKRAASRRALFGAFYFTVFCLRSQSGRAAAVPRAESRALPGASPVCARFRALSRSAHRNDGGLPLGNTAQFPAHILLAEFSVKRHKNARQYIEYSLRFLRSLTKNRTAQSAHRNYAVLP